MATETRSSQVAKNHLEAMRHPLRHKCWEILHTRVASPKDIADELGEPIPNVSHHIKRLVALGCAEKVAEKKVRGAIQHFYKATEQVLLDAEEWERVRIEDPRHAEYLLYSFMQSQLDDYTSSIKAGTLGSDGRWHVSRVPLKVDAQGEEEVLALGLKMEEELAGIVQRASERRSESDEVAIPMSACISLFKSAPGEAAA